MIPLRDSVRSSSRPIMVYAIVLVNTLVFFHELSLSDNDLGRFFFEYGLIARDFWRDAPLIERFTPVFSSMFIHAGWVHFGSNMLFLWVFGDNVEDRMGRTRFLAFYFGSGIAAALAQLWASPSSPLPMIGASGAIAGVLGAYLRLFPRARVIALVPIFFFLQILEVPATLFLAFWFFIQLASGTLALVATDTAVGGPAFWAHIGGFVAGFILGPLLARRRRVEVLPPW